MALPPTPLTDENTQDQALLRACAVNGVPYEVLSALFRAEQAADFGRRLLPVAEVPMPYQKVFGAKPT